MLADIKRNGNEGIGNPEPLRHDFAGYWSRRITDEHRIVYKIADDEVRIAPVDITTAELVKEAFGRLTFEGRCGSIMSLLLVSRAARSESSAGR